MKPNELRLENWVNNNEEDYQITSATLMQLERGDSIANPIPITELWLKRFGFKQDEDYKDIWYLPIIDDEVILKYHLVENLVKIVDYSSRNTWQFGRREYVHEIQNLYYVLMQEELQIKNNLSL